jgi:hypothetical protein
MWLASWYIISDRTMYYVSIVYSPRVYDTVRAGGPYSRLLHEFRVLSGRTLLTPKCAAYNAPARLPNLTHEQLHASSHPPPALL